MPFLVVGYFEFEPGRFSAKRCPAEGAEKGTGRGMKGRGMKPKFSCLYNSLIPLPYNAFFSVL
jgi:hypothetical protein